MFYVLSFKF